jgi:hypothetical protein
MTFASPSIASVTPTICDLIRVPRPALSRANRFDELWRRRDPAPIRNVLVYLPDAIGAHLFRDYPQTFEPILAWAPIVTPALAELPSVTPVCLASMFTGAAPEAHGIRRYEKPVLRCDTLFDALARAGRKVALVATEDSSMERIFRDRAIEYFSEPHDREVTDRVLRLLDGGRHHLIVAYHQEYDDAMHATEPRSPQALRALSNHVDAFSRMAEAAASAWRSPFALLMATDHGTHLDPETGQGAHGSDLPDDLEVNLFWDIHS